MARVGYLMDRVSRKIPAWEWYGWHGETLTFPGDWTISEQRMKGHDAETISQTELRRKLQDPIDSPTLGKLARGKRKCCIIFDDMTRPTKTSQILPTLLDELLEAGLNKEKIIFVMATGAHAGRTLIDFQKKIGKKIPENFLVFVHNPYENLEDIGETSFGTPIHVNREVMDCDLKISLGAMLPHFGFGYGGGSKMLLPGVSGIESISKNHHIREGTGPGMVVENRRRLDSEEAAGMAGLDFIINVFLNGNCDASDIVCGDPVEAHRAGMDIAKEHYATKIVEDADIAIGNGYPMANEGYKAYHIALESVRDGGDLVFLLYTPEGCRVHYYNGRFGTGFGGQGWSPDVYVKSPWKMERVLCVSPEINKSDNLYYGKGSKWVKNWDDCLKLLEEKHDNNVHVALYPTAAMQISRENASNK
jgi:nickel-dependent lactate racemase